VTTDAIEHVMSVEAGADAFELVFERHRDRALRLAYVLCGDATVAEDLVAEAFARMYPKWRRGGIGDAGAYLRRAVVNQVNGRFRRLAYQRRVDATAARAPGATTIDVAVAQREDLRVALLTLPPRMRAAVVLRHLEDLSEADTAALLGISVGAVKSSVARGLERLRTMLELQEGTS
jgi:RNA polymerase sigma-70 factor (sigma-E family)